MPESRLYQTTRAGSWICLSILCSVFSTSAMVQPAAAQPLSLPLPINCSTVVQRINLLQGYASSLRRELNPSCSEANILISAKAGQFMVLVLSSPGPGRFQLTSPDGSSESGPVGNGGVIFNKTLTKTGDYRLRVTESTTAKLWTGQILLTAVIHPQP
jgi:hypothetical protein